MSDDSESEGRSTNDEPTDGLGSPPPAGDSGPGEPAEGGSSGRGRTFWIRYTDGVQNRENSLKDSSVDVVSINDQDQDAEANDSPAHGEEDEQDVEDPSLSAVKLRHEETKLENREQNLHLRKVLAYAAIGMVAAQLVLANFYFGIYLGNNVVNPDAKIMIAWLSATVVEVIGILLVIARSLFPVKSHPKTNNKTTKRKK